MNELARARRLLRNHARQWRRLAMAAGRQGPLVHRLAREWFNAVAADHSRPTTNLSAVAGADDLEANQRAKERRQ